MKISWFRTLLGSISGLIVWAVHFAVVYSLVGIGCEQEWHRMPLVGMNRLTALQIALTLAALALIAWIGWDGWRSYRNADRGGAKREDSGRWRFLSLVTIAIAVLAFVSTIMTAVPIIMLMPCK